MNQIKKKYYTDSSFRSQMDQAQKKYTNALQRAYYSTFTKFEEDMITFAGKDQQGDSIYLIFGNQQQNSQKKSPEKFYIYFVNVLQEFFSKQSNIYGREKCNVSIIYFNTFCDDTNPYISFRGVYRSLPFKYFEYLKKLIILHPTFTLKTLDWIVTGSINKYLKGKTEYLDKIQDLSKFKIKLTNQFLFLIREEIRVLDYPDLIKKAKFQSSIKFSNKITQKPNLLMSKSHIQFKTIDSTKPTKSEQFNTIFLNSLKNNNDPTKKKLQQYELSDIGVPIILKSMIMFLKLNPEFLQTQGIFRRTVSIDDQKQAANQIFNGKYDYIQKIKNPHIIAVLIKKFFNNLIQPLFPYQLYDQLVKSNNITNDTQMLKNIIKKLPILNYTCLMFLMNFFVQEVIPRQKSNLMSSYNVAVVFLPCLLRSKQSGLEDLIYSKKLVLVVQTIIKNVDQIFGNKKQQNRVYRRSSKQKQKKFEQQYIFKDNTQKNSIDQIIRTFEKQEKQSTKQ